MGSKRYETRKVWSPIHGRWGYRIFDLQRDVFVSPWQPLGFKAEILAAKLNAA